MYDSANQMRVGIILSFWASAPLSALFQVDPKRLLLILLLYSKKESGRLAGAVITQPHSGALIGVSLWYTATNNFVGSRTLHRRRSLEVEWALKNRSHESQFLLAQANRNWSLFAWAKRNYDSWLLYFSALSTSKRCQRWRVREPMKFTHYEQGVSPGLIWVQSIDLITWWPGTTSDIKW